MNVPNWIPTAIINVVILTVTCGTFIHYMDIKIHQQDEKINAIQSVNIRQQAILDKVDKLVFDIDTRVATIEGSLTPLRQDVQDIRTDIKKLLLMAAPAVSSATGAAGAAGVGTGARK
jgi:uncharacterized protein YoxC